MANHGCNNGTLVGTNYASPVPVIGLYIAAASLVCMLLMLYDIVSGFRKGKRWLPCKLFSLNSVTLTLLSIATKLPLDLTTPMPSVVDQISKLCGTSLMCITMCFLMPSIGSKDDSQCLADMAALSILIITVIVNVCLQLSTGLIVLFIPEHIIIICCMLIMLVILWISSLSVDVRRGFSLEHNKSILLLGEQSMLERLKLCYLYCFNSDPQFVICKHPIWATVSGLCLLSLVVLIQAAFRSLILNQLSFCKGTSDYGWSMWPIVAIQILTVVVGSVATSFRWLSSFKHMNLDWIKDFEKENPNAVLNLNRIVGINSEAAWGCNLNCVFVVIVSLIKRVIMFWTLILFIILQFITLVSTCWGIFNHNEEEEECEDLLDGSDIELDIWSIRKRRMDMKEWMESSQMGSRNLRQLLSKRSPTEQVRTMEVGDNPYPIIEGIEMSFLSFVLLVKEYFYLGVGDSRYLVQAVNECFEIIEYIDSGIKWVNLENRKKSNLARAVWKVDIDTIGYNYDLYSHELHIIDTFVEEQRVHNGRESSDVCEQLVVDMLHVILSQLPNTIYKQVMDSPAEEYEETLKLGLINIHKVESLDAHIRWHFPVGCNITSLIVNPVPATTPTLTPDDVISQV